MLNLETTLETLEMQKEEKEEKDQEEQEDQQEQEEEQWRIAGKLCSKEAFIYFSRMLMLYFICIISCVNLSLGKEPQQIWMSFLSISLGGIGVTLLNKMK